MSSPRSALKFDLFADSSRKGTLDELGDPLQVIARHIDFGELAGLADALIERSDGRKGGRPAYPTEVMVRILVLKRLYNLSDEQALLHNSRRRRHDPNPRRAYPKTTVTGRPS